MPVPGEFTLRPATAEDTSALCDLFASVFPGSQKADPAVVRWQYWDNVAGPAVSWVAEHRGEVVSHLVGIPARATIHGASTRVAITGDAATAESARRRGLLGALAGEMWRDCAQRGIPLSLSLPNDSSRGTLYRAGMTELGRMRLYLGAVDPRFLAERFNVPPTAVRLGVRALFGGPRPGAARRVESVPDGLEELIAASRPADANGIIHDGRWWQWRYLDAPLNYAIHELRRGGDLAAVVASRVREIRGLPLVTVLDLVARDVPAARTLLAGVAEGHPDAAGLALLAWPHSRAAWLAWRSGLRPIPHTVSPAAARLGIVDAGAGVTPPEPNTWEITWGDFDHS